MKRYVANILNLYAYIFIFFQILILQPLMADILPVGTEVVNQASIHFKDETGESYVITTNIVVITIRQVFSASLDGDQNLVGLSGKTVSFFHILQNTGNGSDVYCASVSNVINDNGDFSQIRLIHDLDQNGRADESDPTIASDSGAYSTTLFLGSGQTAHLIVLGDIPDTATVGSNYKLLLAVKAKNGTSICQDDSVTDIGFNADSDYDTNQDQVQITDQAILIITKNSVYQTNTPGIEDDTISYQVTIENIGNRPARDILITDNLPQYTSFQTNSLQTISDFITTPATDDGDNGSDGSIPTHDGNTPGQITGEIDYLDINGSIVFSYVLDIDDTAAGDTVIENTIQIKGDLDENSATEEPAVISNKTSQTLPKVFAVQITDTASDAGLNVNDGGDDDSIANDQQYVDQVHQGELVLFNHLVINKGNSTDTFSLIVSNSTFPDNTVFQFYHANQSSFLLDTNSDGNPDTGPMNPEETMLITIGAVLPTHFTGNGPYLATITAQSSGNNTVQDNTQEQLGAVISYRVDIANTNTAQGLHDETDADPVSQITTTQTFLEQSPVEFDLFVANEGLKNDQYQISVWMDSSATVLPPKDWQIKFTNTSGAIITSTPAIQPGHTFNFKAIITIPNNMSPQVIPIFFKVYSVVTEVWDIKQDAIEIQSTEGIQMSPDNEKTVSPGGSVEYIHNVQNIGNTSLAVIISVLSQSLMTHSLLLPQLYSGSDVASYRTIQNFVVGDKVVIFDYSANKWQIVELVSDNADSIAIPLDPKDTLRFKVRVMAPTSIAAGSTDILLVQSGILGSSFVAINTDQTIAASAQLDMNKMGIRDSNCDADIYNLNGFETSHFHANPGECIVWQLIVLNVSAEPVCQVTVHDKAPAFTFVQGAPVIYAQPAPGETGICSVNNESIECFVGNPMDINSDGVMEEHCLRSGEKVEVRFRVQIE
ncbi:protein containing DUF11 [Candidatus Magnetomorum sp. HK-1]|nr:protein containing DUF11 [Candidatus Magnetomorum sp. HK-1]